MGKKKIEDLQDGDYQITFLGAIVRVVGIAVRPLTWTLGKIWYIITYSDGSVRNYENGDEVSVLDE